jgi:hypothetical protein
LSEVFNLQVGIMRFIPVLALMSSAISLAACGGGGDSSGGGTLSVAAMRASVNGVCTIGQTNCIPPGTPGTPGTDGDNDGTDNGDDTDGNTGGGAGGNNANITAGNRAIALQKMVWTKPTLANEIARGQLSSNETAGMAATEAAIMSANKPKTLRMETDTNAPNNSQFAVPVMMNENVYGTRDLRWIGLGHTNTALNNIVIYDKPVSDPTRRAMYYSRGTNDFRYLDPASLTGFSTGEPADVDNDFIWDQIKSYMGSKANGGTGADYREYSVESKSDNRDELLQVWAWGDSYTAQYQNQLGGGTPKQQVWSFGGRATTVMPTGGTATFRGRYVGTAEASGWTKIGDTIDPNVPWMVQGSSELTANFGNNTVDGFLKTESWTSYQEKLKANYTWYTANAEEPVAGNINGTRSVETGEFPNYKFYYSQLNLDGKIVEGDTTVTTAGSTGPVTTRPKNAIVGTATFAYDYSTSDNPMLGGFFGNNASEVTGVFTASGVTSDPNGGSTGVTDPRSAEIVINGSFNANTPVNGAGCPTTATCPP